MSVLKTLNLVAAPKRTNDPIVQRRNKLITQLQQQRALAEDASHIVITQRWCKGEDGSKRLVERQKRVKRWWQENVDGSISLVIRYGSKPIEFEKGKGAIQLKGDEELLTILPKLIVAASEGEFDALIAAANKQRSIPSAKAK